MFSCQTLQCKATLALHSVVAKRTPSLSHHTLSEHTQYKWLKRLRNTWPYVLDLEKRCQKMRNEGDIKGFRDPFPFFELFDGRGQKFRVDRYRVSFVLWSLTLLYLLVTVFSSLYSNPSLSAHFYKNFFCWKRFWDHDATINVRIFDRD